jgi:hypothetical protein
MLSVVSALKKPAIEEAPESSSANNLATEESEVERLEQELLQVEPSTVREVS